MVNFAQLDENNYVIRVVEIDNSFLVGADGIENEELGVSKCKEIYGQETVWKKTIEGNIGSANVDKIIHPANIGYQYNEEVNGFIPPQPYPSFIFDKDTMCWESTIPIPRLSKEEESLGAWYDWQEKTKEWILKFPD